jgi:hypothetical protein
MGLMTRCTRTGVDRTPHNPDAIGVPIVFDGKVDVAAQIININVVQINNQIVVISPPRHHDEDGDDQGEDEDE